jgi:hypothetical protein
MTPAGIPLVGKLRTVRRLMRHHAKTHGVSPRRQLAELLYLGARNGIGPLEYYLLGLFRPSVPWEQKRNSVSKAWYWKAVQRINPPRLREIATNKVASSLVLRSAGIPTPRIHGILDRGSGLSFDDEPLRDAADLGALVKKRSLRGVCFKPISAWAGRGFVKLAFEREGDAVRARIDPSGPTLSLGELCGGYLDMARHGSYLIQDVVEQHPAVARFHPASLNTIRVWMVQREPGRWEMFCAVLRMGVGEMTVDNMSAGGIGAPVDTETGRLGSAILRGLDPDRGIMLTEYEAHPTTGVRIEGEALPMWSDVVPLCRRTCAVFPFYAFMGLDVGIGIDGPVIVEVEADPHSMIQLYCKVGLRPMLESLSKRRK